MAHPIDLTVEVLDLTELDADEFLWGGYKPKTCPAASQSKPPPNPVAISTSPEIIDLETPSPMSASPSESTALPTPSTPEVFTATGKIKSTPNSEKPARKTKAAPKKAASSAKPTSKPKATKKKATSTASKRAPKHDPSHFQQWRSALDDIEFYDSISTKEDEPAPLTTKQSLKRKREEEESDIGSRIQAIATQIGWSQPAHKHGRTTKLSGGTASAIPLKYKEERMDACSICEEKVHKYELTKLDCSHKHCKDCLERNILMVINDPAAWPAKCCRPLKHDIACQVLEPEEFARFLEIKMEKEGVSSISCWKCGEGIKTANFVGGGDQGFCDKCEALTCRHCVKEMHTGACLLDPEIEKLLKMASGKRWSKCPKCSNMVERNQGCNHMSCRCGAHFCYKCGRELRLCNGQNCEQIDFNNDKWTNQAPNSKVTPSALSIDAYRKQAKQKEDEVRNGQIALKIENFQHKNTQELVTELTTLRAKVSKKDRKDGINSVGAATSPTAGAQDETSAKGIFKALDIASKFPAIAKALETNLPAPTPGTVEPKMLQSYRDKYPSLMKAYDENIGPRAPRVTPITTKISKLTLPTPDISPFKEAGGMSFLGYSPDGFSDAFEVALDKIFAP